MIILYIFNKFISLFQNKILDIILSPWNLRIIYLENYFLKSKVTDNAENFNQMCLSQLLWSVLFNKTDIIILF